MSNGMPYDSDAGRGTAAAITALMTGRGYAQSAKVAAAIGPYERYEENRDAHNDVMRMHRDASYAIPDSTCVDTALLDAARASWEDAVSLGDAHGYRNAQATVLAPTGTISFLMDCDTTGVEPDFSLVKFKELVGGGQMTIVNRTIPMALRTLGYSDEQIEQIEAYVNEHATIIGAPELAAEHLPVFDVAVGERAISHMGHIKMMGAVQPFLSGAISKTVNLPQTATVEDIADAYLEAWRCGVKALAIYRDGSKTAQALRTDAQQGVDTSSIVDAVAEAVEGMYTQEQLDSAVAKAVTKAKAEAGPARKRMPVERQSITHKFSIGGHEGYITAGVYDDGTVGEIFLTDVGKEGSALRGHDELVRDGDLDRAAVRRAARDARAEVQLHALRPGGDHAEPRDPVRQVDARLHHALAGLALPGHRHPGGARHPHARGPRPQDGRGRGHVDGVRHRQPVQRRRERPAAPAPARRRRPRAGTPGTPTVAGSQPATTRAAAEALTDKPPVVPARLAGLDLGPACNQCGGMMQRTGSCYTCSSCGNNTGCG